MRALIVCVLAACTAFAGSAAAEKTIRIAPQSNLAILDPDWTTATVTRTHGYMIYDTLFGTDAHNRVQPQMVDTWTESADHRTWTFTLRPGLAFHDGAPVTSADVIASLARWAKKDNLGQRLAAATDHWDAIDARTFRLVLREPFGMVLEALGKPGANVPFILPRRVAETPVDRQIEDTTGSGPYIFRKDEWKPGALVVYAKNPKYVPRSEPPSGTAGGKRVFVDRVEWLILPDAQTQVNALVKGEVDLVEQPSHEHYAALRANPHIRVYDNPWGAQVLLRFNHLYPPFNDPRIRRAALVALSQLPFLKTQYVSPDLYRTCLSMYPCGTPYETSQGMDGLLRGDIRRARALLKEAGYDGTPVVLLQPTDLATIAKLPVVAAQQLRLAGFKVDLQAMDWQTLVGRRAKRDPPAKGGWNIFITSFNGLDVANPVVNPAMNASCEKAWPGWPCDAELETLRADFLKAVNESARKKVAAAAQARALAIGTHAVLGEYLQPVAARKEITGVVESPVYVYWNLDRK